MARNRSRFSAARINKWIAEGRGLGHGENYKPWLKVQNVPSKGYVNRIPGWKTRRQHEFMSNLEANYFYLLEWSPSVVDVREQYPLLPLEETLAIADQCGIKHPKVPGSNEPIVMTTDIVVDVKGSGPSLERARTIKPAQDLSSERVLEKFEIERRYWLRRKVDWAIITERNIPEALLKNIQWVHPYFEISEKLNVLPIEILKAKNILSEFLRNGLALTASCNACDDQLGLESGSSLALVRHFLATRRWVIDMRNPINPRNPLILLQQSVFLDEQNGLIQKHAA